MSRRPPRLLVLCCCLLFYLVAASSAAAEPLTAARLLGACSSYVDAPSSADGQFCIAYVRGFLDSIDLADQRDGRLIIPARDHRFAFCLGRNVSAERVITQLVSTTGMPSTSGSPTAAELLNRTLQRLYPC